MHSSQFEIYQDKLTEGVHEVPIFDVFEKLDGWTRCQELRISLLAEDGYSELSETDQFVLSI